MPTDRIREVLFIGLPGPTHNYGGLAADNVASSLHRGKTSSPREADRQALSLVKLLWSLGVEVGIMPPQLRPHLPLLREHFSGDGDALIRQAAKENPLLLEKASSSSAMWVANAATVTAAADAGDKRLHLTVANLYTNLHRRIEAADTFRVLAAILPDAVVHAPLPGAEGFRDEGAANHMRLSPRHEAKGFNVYVYGADGSAGDPPSARQNLQACKALKSQHLVGDDGAVFVRQNPAAIEQGIFHNDVIAVSNESLLLVHEQAYANGYKDIERIEAGYQAQNPGKTPFVIVCKSSELTLEEAVRTYFFNSQIVTMADETGADAAQAIIAPMEVKELYEGKAAKLMERLCEDSSNPIEEVHYVDLRQSMNNGGGPACLRLRVPMSEAQLAAIRANVNVIADGALLDGLEDIIERLYPEKIEPADLADPALYHNCRKVLGEMSVLMKLPLI